MTNYFFENNFLYLHFFDVLKIGWYKIYTHLHISKKINYKTLWKGIQSSSWLQNDCENDNNFVYLHIQMKSRF